VSPVLDSRAQVRDAISGILGVSAQGLKETDTIDALGMNSLMLAEIVVVVEERLLRRVDTAALSTELSYDMTLGQFIDRLAAALTE
jgi:acyl carrier protein